jgi:hypothetical protein
MGSVTFLAIWVIHSGNDLKAELGSLFQDLV